MQPTASPPIRTGRHGLRNVRHNNNRKMKKELKQLISQAKTEIAIKILIQYEKDLEIANQIKLVSARFFQHKKSIINGTLSQEEINSENNKINKALIELIDSIPQNLNIFSIIESEIENIKVQLKNRKDKIHVINNAENVANFRGAFNSLENEQKKLNQGRYNIAVIGKTGVGKSSLINYLFGNANVAKTGVGKPVTVQGFHKINFEINSIPATLFDSWGLEVGKAEIWLNELNKELKGRDIDKPASEWFHTVLYCIASSGARVEEFETRIINKLIKAKYNVVIVLTKSDLADEDDIAELKESIQKDLFEKVVFCQVCSEEKKLKSGKTEKFGAEQLYVLINNGFWESITLRMPDRCINILINIILYWEKWQDHFIETMTTNFNPDKVHKILERNSYSLINHLESEKCMKVISEEVDKTIRMYENFSTMLNFQPLMKKEKFEFSIKKVQYVNYEKSKSTNIFFSIFLFGLPLLVGKPRKEYMSSLKAVVRRFCIDLQKETLNLKPIIQSVLRKMAREQE